MSCLTFCVFIIAVTQVAQGAAFSKTAVNAFDLAVPCCKCETSRGWMDYHLPREKQFFSGAYQFCLRHGLELATVRNQEAHMAIVKALTIDGDKENYFLTAGGIEGDYNTKKSPWFWYPDMKDKFEFTRWAPTQPDDVNGIENCMAYNPSGPNPYLWNDIHCRNKHRFICQTPNSENTWHVS